MKLRKSIRIGPYFVDQEAIKPLTGQDIAGCLPQTDNPRSRIATFCDAQPWNDLCLIETIVYNFYKHRFVLEI